MNLQSMKLRTYVFGDGNNFCSKCRLHFVVVRTYVDTYNVVYYLTINTRAYVVTTNASKRRLRTYVPVVMGIYSSCFHMHPSIGGSV